MASPLQRVIADGHLHLYPCFNPALAMRSLFDNLDRLAAVRWPGHDGTAGVSRMAFLAERFDCHFFRGLCACPAPGGKGSGLALRSQERSDGEGWAHAGPVFAFEPGPEKNCVIVREEGRPPLLLMAGRQIVTAERLEVLALTLDEAPADGAPAGDVLDDILHAGGIPVLSWAPGKWFFRRGQVVRALIERFAPGAWLIGDSSLRPTLWGLPILMRRALARGFTGIAGSDPLPFSGEERVMGAYGFSLECPWDGSRPVSSIRDALLRGHVQPRWVGRRGSLGEVLHRLKKNRESKTTS